MQKTLCPIVHGNIQITETKKKLPKTNFKSSQSFDNRNK